MPNMFLYPVWKVSPCKDCTRRQIGCRCEEYQAWYDEYRAAKDFLYSKADKEMDEYWRSTWK